MNNIHKEKYLNQAILYENMRLYFINTAKEVIADCQKSNIRITGLEAFKLTGAGIQPSQEHSIDFNADEDNWQKAITFLENVEDLTYLYEIWYEGY
jgi:hypothetical protein